MFFYEVFGGRLASTLRFPELRPATPDQPVSWTFERREEMPELAGLGLLGEDRTSGDLEMRLSGNSEWFRLDYGPLGTYDVSVDGSRILWYPGSHDCENCARQCVLGRAIALAIHVSGDICLHASCVDVGIERIAFLAPKGTGKSTIAAAIIAAGGSLVTDDMLRVQPAGSTYFGVQRLRLHHDSAEVASRAGIESHAARNGKRVTSSLPEPGAGEQLRPLSAVYLLEVDGASPPEHAAREQVTGSRAVLAFVSNLMLGPLIGRPTESLLRAAVRLAAATPVYTLRIPRGYDRLPSVVSQLASWHGAEGSLTPGRLAGRLPEDRDVAQCVA